MSSGWNAARRVAASERMHTRKPWLKSTGPRTAEGKARSRQNALKHGQRSAPVVAERRATVDYLRRQRAFLQQVRLLLRVRRQSMKLKKGKPTNEVMDFLSLSSLRRQGSIEKGTGKTLVTLGNSC